MVVKASPVCDHVAGVLQSFESVVMHRLDLTHLDLIQGVDGLRGDGIRQSRRTQTHERNRWSVASKMRS